MLVISKIEIPKNKNAYALDVSERQVFCEFDKETRSDGAFSKYDYYKLHLGADEDFNIVSTD